MVVGIKYIIPRYDDGLGDVTDIIRDEGMETVLKSADVVIKEISRERGLSIKNMNSLAKRVTKRDRQNPIFLSADEVMVQLKVRRSLVGGDPVFGYFNVNEITFLSDNQVFLKDDGRLSILESDAKGMERIDHAREFKRLMVFDILRLHTVDLEEVQMAYKKSKVVSPNDFHKSWIKRNGNKSE